MSQHIRGCTFETFKTADNADVQAYTETDKHGLIQTLHCCASIFGFGKEKEPTIQTLYTQGISPNTTHVHQQAWCEWLVAKLWLDNCCLKEGFNTASDRHAPSTTTQINHHLNVQQILTHGS